MTALAETREILDSLRDDPVGFQEIVLGRDLWSKQRAICEAIVHSPITVVPAGRAVGKSFLLAGLVLWWLYTRRPSRVITTGPDHRQVCSVLWSELRAALLPRYDHDGRLVAPRLELDYEHLTQGEGSPQRLVVEGAMRWEALGFACKTDEGFSGQHHPELLVIVDEASGITPRVWAAVHGLAARRIVVCGNPIKYDTHFRELNDLAERGSRRITSVRIQSTEHPHAELEESPVGAVSRSWLLQQAELYGRNSPWWRSNIEALFPGQESVRFLPAAWLDACTSAEVLDDPVWRSAPAGDVWMGVDVGGGVGADRSVIVVRNAKRILDIFASEWHGVLDDARHRLEPVILDMVDRWRVPMGHVIYDQGGPGRSLASYLAREAAERAEAWRRKYAHQPASWIQDHAPAPFTGAFGYFGASKGGKLYINRRTANAFALRDRIDPARKGHVPFYIPASLAEWPRLREELGELRAPELEEEEGKVKQKLENKDVLMARLKRSPDLMDALLMTFTRSSQ